MEATNTTTIKVEVDSMKESVIETVKEDLLALVDQRTKELNTRKSKESNIILFNIPESPKTDSISQKKKMKTT